MSDDLEQPITEFFSNECNPIVGIVGHGFVGQAVDNAIDNALDKVRVDPKYGIDIDQLVEKQPMISYVCLPTPVQDNGRIDAAIVVDTILKLIRKTSSAVVLKSTVTPDIIDKLARTLDAEFQSARFIYAPEFLKEGNANEDYLNPHYMVFGGLDASVAAYMSFLETNTTITFPRGNVHVCHPVEASIIKYAVNNFLSMKVTFFNQLLDVIKDEQYTCNPNTIIRALGSEPRIGVSHTRVPGPDGKRGFGGACFPKDLSAWNAYTGRMSLLDKVMEINNEYRKEYTMDDREKAANVHFLDRGKVKADEVVIKEEETNVDNEQVEIEFEDQDDRGVVGE